MIIITKNYPQVYSKEINNNLGTYKKHNQLTNSFLATKKNTIFTSLDNPMLLSKTTKINSKDNGFLLEIIFHGFNYSNKRFKLFRPKYYIDVHKSEIFICNESSANTFKSRVHKRRLIFFSYDNNLLKQIETAIKKFRLPNIYTGKGIFSRHDSYFIKKLRKRK